MPLTHAERKECLPRGAQHDIAEKCKATDAYVSGAVAGTIQPKSRDKKAKLRRVQTEIARKIGRPLEDVFTPEELLASAPPAALQRTA